MKRPRNAPPLNRRARCEIAPGLSGNGYSYVPRGTRRVLAHRAAWEEKVGPLPKGVELHHICRNRRCRRLEHLQPMKTSEHRSKHGRRDSHCRNGHRRTPANTYRRPNGDRECLTCKRNTQARRIRVTRETKEAA